MTTVVEHAANLTFLRPKTMTPGDQIPRSAEGQTDGGATISR